MYKDMEREERTKELARRITNALFACDDFTYEDMACSITYLVGIADRISEKVNNAKSGTFTKYVFDMIGSVHKVSSDKQEWRPSTEHPATASSQNQDTDPSRPKKSVGRRC